MTIKDAFMFQGIEVTVIDATGKEPELPYTIENEPIWGDGWIVTMTETKEYCGSVVRTNEGPFNASYRGVSRWFEHLKDAGAWLYGQKTGIEQTTPLFPIGRVVITEGAALDFGADESQWALQQHQKGNWGDLASEDWQANEDALQDGGRLFSSYRFDGDRVLWVITEADRRSTTILLPDDY